MILTADYHTHTPYSHGKNTVAENVANAKESGLKEMGVTDHGFAHITFGLSKKKLAEYKAECAAAEKEYGVRVFVGMEANILGRSGKTDLTEKYYDDFDIYLCGNHIVVWYDTFGDFCSYGVGNLLKNKFCKTPTKKQIENNTKAYIEAVKNNPIDILTHLNFKCPANALEVAKCAADYGTYIELNGKKQHLTDEELADILAKTEARFVIDSDAHSASRVGEVELIKAQLARVNAPLNRIDNIDGRTPNFRFREFKNRR